jgi:hypothetical protein
MVKVAPAPVVPAGAAAASTRATTPTTTTQTTTTTTTTGYATDDELIVQPIELHRHTYKWWLVAFIVCTALFVAADLFTVLALPLPDTSDSFIAAGWIAHIVGMCLMVTTVLLTIFRKSPYSSAIVLLALVSLSLFLGGTILHTSRLVRRFFLLLLRPFFFFFFFFFFYPLFLSLSFRSLVAALRFRFVVWQ